MRSLTAVITATLMLLLSAMPALAHVTVQPSEAEAGAFGRFVVRVPNERDDAATTRVEVQLPPLASVSFQPAEGWERTETMRTLDEPLRLFGQEITEVVGTVTWEGGRIEPGEFQDFGMSIRTPDDPTVLEFQAVQVYDSGEEVRWVGAEGSDEPAARLSTLALTGDGGQLATLAALQESSGALETRGNAALGMGILALLVSIAALLITLRRRPVAEEGEIVLPTGTSTTSI